MRAKRGQKSIQSFYQIKRKALLLTEKLLFNLPSTFSLHLITHNSNFPFTTFHFRAEAHITSLIFLSHNPRVQQKKMQRQKCQKNRTPLYVQSI